MAPHQALVETLFKEMRGRIKEDDKSVPQKRRRLALLVGVRSRRRNTNLVPQARIGRRRELIFDERRGRGQGIFPPRRDRGQPRRQAARYSGRRQRLGALQAARSRISPPATLLETVTEVGIGARSGRGDKRPRLRQVNEQWRTDSARLHWLGAADRRGPRALRGDRRHRLLRRRRPLAEDWLISSPPATTDQRGPLRPRRQRRDAADAGQRARQPERPVFDVDARARQVVHPHQRHPRQLPPRHRPSRPAGRLATLIAGTRRFYLRGFDLFRDFSSSTERRRRPRPARAALSTTAPIEPHPVPRGELHRASSATIPNIAPDRSGLSYSSWSPRRRSTTITRPTTGSKLLKVQEIPSGYDPAATSPSGSRSPRATARRSRSRVVYRKDRQGGSGPLLPLRLRRLRHRHPAGLFDHAPQPASIAASPTPSPTSAAATTSATRWYKAGKLDSRTNTFTDFVDVARGLVAEGYTEAGRIATRAVRPAAS